jgi:hypothetical protein
MAPDARQAGEHLPQRRRSESDEPQAHTPPPRPPEARR